MALSTSSSRWALGLLLCVAVASTINIEPVDASRRELQQQYRRGGRGGYGGKDCEFEGVWTKHLDFFTSKAGKRCKCVDGKWRDCTDAYYKDDYKEPEIKVVYVKEEPKKKEFKDCEIYFEWIKHGDWHVYDDKECRCWDGKFDSCKDLKKPEVVKLVYKEEPKKEFKDCEKDGVWTSHGSQYSSRSRMRGVGAGTGYGIAAFTSSLGRPTCPASYMTPCHQPSPCGSDSFRLVMSDGSTPS